MSEFDDWDGFGPPEMRPLPRGRTGMQRFLVVASIVALALVLVGLGVWLVALATPGPRQPGAPAAKGPSDSITESFVVTATGSASQEVTPAGPGLPAVVVGEKRFQRAPKIAFRKDGALYVAREDGGDQRKTVLSASGAFSLSPDGKWLAFVDGASKQLAIAETDSGRVTTVGPAAVEAPVWAPSSTWLAFENAGEVRRVESDGSKLRFLGKGDEVAIGPDDKTCAFSQGTTITVVSDMLKAKVIKAKGKVTGLALGKSRLFYATAGAAPDSLTLHSAKIDGTDDRELVGGSSDPKAGQYGAMQLSPDGSWIAYAVRGDDAHSRLHVMRVDGTLDTKLSLRHDDYTLRWSSDGKKLFFVDGNAVQGDTTQLMSARPDNTMRLTLVRGAGL